MNEWQTIAESYKEASDLAEQLILKQSEIIQVLEVELKLHKQRITVLCKEIEILKDHLLEQDTELYKLVRK
jgi:hypothetical protein